MNKYTVSINVYIVQKVDMEGRELAPNTHLSYRKEFDIEGENLTQLAPQIDRIVENMRDDGIG